MIRILLLCAVASCAAMSPSTYTNVTCESCRVPAVAVGQPIVVGMDWPCSSDECSEDVKPKVTCEGVPCDVETTTVTGGGYLRVRPTAAGRLVINLRLNGFGHTEQIKLVPVDVHQPDRLVLACFARRPAETAWQPCADGVRTGDDVRVDAIVLAGSIRLPGAAPVLTVDGEPREIGKRDVEAAWRCAETLSDAVGAGPGHSCFAYEITAGPHHVAATFGGLASKQHFEVRSR